MPRIYFDTNIYSNLKANRQPVYQELNRLLAIYGSRLSFYFSCAHIRDKRKDHTDHKFDDFDFMENYTSDNYLAYDPLAKMPGFYLATPRMVFDDDDPAELDLLKNFFDVGPDDSPEITMMKGMIKALYGNIPVPQPGPELDQLPPDQRKLYEALFPTDRSNMSLFNVVENMSNYTRDLFMNSELYKQLRTTLDGTMNNGKATLNGEVNFNEAFKDTQLKKTFIDFIRDNMHHPNKDEIPFYDFYPVAYQMLDSLGVDKDKISAKNSLVNIQNDALHSYFAHYCDIFVTEDYGTIKKTKALYELLEIGSQVVTPAEFNALLPELLMELPDDRAWFFQKLLYDLQNSERREAVEVDGLTCQRLDKNHRYLDHFDVIIEVFGPTHRQIILCKGNVHLLSDASFSEQAKIIEAAFAVFGKDIDNHGSFVYQDIQQRERTLQPRKWVIDGATIELKYESLIKKFALVINLPDPVID